MNLSTFDYDRPLVMIVSHERSGTHFLMNSIAACFGYNSRPWLNFDQRHINLNFHAPTMVRKSLAQLGKQRVSNIIKSHHQVEFFSEVLEHTPEQLLIFYIYRDPVAVMLSFWRFVHGLGWHEGPELDNPISFARAEPCGRMMRYQFRQYPSILHRWAAHCAGWLAAANYNSRVILVRYEDLDSRYNETIEKIGRRLGSVRWLWVT